MNRSRAHAWILGATDFRAYEAFNYFECVAWITIGVALHLRFRQHPADKRAVIARTSIAFIVFGISDYLEAPTHGLLPPWLWAWKILCGAYLLKCGYDYLGRERFRWFDRRKILALCCLLAVLFVVLLRYYFRNLPMARP